MVSFVFSAEDEEALARKAAEEEEAKMMTLDQWKAQQAKKEGPTFNLRKAGEGSDLDPKWKKTYAYKKDVLTQEDEEDEVSTAYYLWMLLLKFRFSKKATEFKTISTW